MRVYPITGIHLLCIIAMLALDGMASAKEDLNKSPGEKREQIIDELKRREIYAYGMVVDQNGDPVIGAEVLISWEEFANPFPGPTKKDWIITDDNGYWDFQRKALRAMVREARCEGYVFDRKQQNYGGITSDDVNNNRTSPTNRLIMRLHKLSDPTFLVKQVGRFGRATPEAPLVRKFDIFQTKSTSAPATPNQSTAGLYPDLAIRVAQQGTNGAWRVEYLASEDGNGLIVTNALLFEAPAAGYVSEYVLEGVHEQDFPRYLYLRSRNPAIYTRFDIVYSLRPDSCVISYELSSNPYGSRSLEPNAELEPLWQLREQLSKEAKAEIANGRRLNKADLPKLIKEAKEKDADAQ